MNLIHHYSSYTATVDGCKAQIVHVEANISNGLPGISIIGLADMAINESRERMRTAVNNSGLIWPRTKVTIGLSPAGIRKNGASFDIAMVMAVLGASGEKLHTHKTLYLGELGLDGSLRQVHGLLPALVAAKEYGIERAVIPYANRKEASLFSHMPIYVAQSLTEVYEFSLGLKELPRAEELKELPPRNYPDIRDVIGQHKALNAATIAAAGGHHMFITGPPGSGKSMIASRIQGLLPALNPDDRVECTAIYSVSEKVEEPIFYPPFVAPHHSMSTAALLGGGSGKPKPGAVSLAHKGILFLDEVSEISPKTIDALRIPLEHKEVRLIRNNKTIIFPADFQLVMAANPCRCAQNTCTCTSADRRKYLSNISGPIRDRIDIFTHTYAAGSMSHENWGEHSTEELAHTILQARQRAQYRWGTTPTGPELRRHYPADEEGMLFLDQKLKKGMISHRRADKMLHLAWTLCDLTGKKKPTIDELLQAEEYCNVN